MSQYNNNNGFGQPQQFQQPQTAQPQQPQQQMQPQNGYPQQMQPQNGYPQPQNGYPQPQNGYPQQQMQPQNGYTQQQQQMPQTPMVGGSMMFDGLDQVQNTGSRIYIPEGSHLLRVVEVKKFVAQQKNCEGFGAELEIVETTSDVSPGTRVNLTLLFDDVQKKKIRQREMKNFLASVYGGFTEGASFEQIDVRTIEYACSSQQPLADKYVRCQASKQISQKGNEYTQRNWYVWGGPDSGHDPGPAFSGGNPAAAAPVNGFGQPAGFGQPMQSQSVQPQPGGFDPNGWNGQG